MERDRVPASYQRAGAGVVHAKQRGDMERPETPAPLRTTSLVSGGWYYPNQLRGEGCGKRPDATRPERFAGHGERI